MDLNGAPARPARMITPCARTAVRFPRDRGLPTRADAFTESWWSGRFRFVRGGPVSHRAMAKRSRRHEPRACKDARAPKGRPVRTDAVHDLLSRPGHGPARRAVHSREPGGSPEQRWTPADWERACRRRLRLRLALRSNPFGAAPGGGARGGCIMPIKVLELHHHGIRIDPLGRARRSARASSTSPDVLGLEADSGRPNIPGVPGFWMYVGDDEKRTQIHLMGATGESPVCPQRGRRSDPSPRCPRRRGHPGGPAGARSARYPPLDHPGSRRRQLRPGVSFPIRSTTSSSCTRSAPAAAIGSPSKPRE